VNSSQNPLTLAAARKSYLRSLHRLDRTPRTQATHRRVLNAFLTRVSNRGAHLVQDVGGRHLSAFQKRLTPKMAGRQMGVVRAFLTYARVKDARQQRVEAASTDDFPGFPTQAVTGGHFLWVPVKDQGIPLRKPLGGKRSPMSDRQLLPLQEIHKTRIHMPYSQLLRLARGGKLPVRKFGKAYYGDPQEVMASLLPPAQEVAAKAGRKP